MGPALDHLATTQHKPCLLILNAFPGVGKLSVARILYEAYGQKEHARLIDNHTLIDPAEMIHPGRTPEHYELRKKLRGVAFEGIVALKGVRITIMTTCSGTEEKDVEAYKEFVSIARRTGWSLANVTLDCEVPENMKRLQNAQREGGKKKLLDASVLKEIRNANTLLDPGNVEGVFKDVEAFTMRLDTTDKGIEGTAELIAQFILRNVKSVTVR